MLRRLPDRTSLLTTAWSMCLMHPVYLAISLAGALAYAITLNGQKAVRFAVMGLLPMAALAALLNPAPATPSTPAADPFNPDAGKEQIRFDDVSDNAWYASAVRYAVENGLMNGTSDTAFSPNATPSRGMIVTILYRLEGSPAVTGTNAFVDVPAGQWYTDAVNWAAANQIVKGTSATTFAPNDSITREQMAAILYRYAVYGGMTAVTLEENLGSFADTAQLSAYAIQAMNWAVGQGLINGSGSNLVPKAQATRAQVAAIIHRYLER